MSITRWDPWGEMVSLREAMDRLLEESVVRPAMTGGEGGRSGGMAGRLPLDVEEQGDNFVVTAPVPGVQPDNVEISVLGDTLRIHAQRREQREEGGEGKRWLMREQRFGAFERTVTLPSPVQADQANAEFRDGILTITLPKAESAKERKIPVRAGSGRGQRPEEIPVETGGGQGRRSNQSS